MTFVMLSTKHDLLKLAKDSTNYLEKKVFFLILYWKLAQIIFGHLLCGVESEETPVVVGGQRESNLWKLVCYV
jgi:hypothetical protein